MDINNIIIQGIGWIAWFLLAISYYRKDTNRIIIVQIMGNLLFCLHYFLLDAYSGLGICFLEMVRDFSYYITDIDNYIFLFTIPVYILGGVFSVKNGIIEIIPIVASIVDGYSLTKKRLIVVTGALISYSLWFVYDFIVGSHSGAITDMIVVISNIYILLFRRNDDSKLFSFK